jgi:uncharacterized protein (DUF433 family)/DNA-binding transcriptional MerR regulator
MSVGGACDAVGRRREAAVGWSGIRVRRVFLGLELGEDLRRGGGVVAYTTQMAAALSGAGVGQLGYWRRTDLFKPEVSDKRPILYSFRDLAALRAFVFLRSETSLQSIRTAVASLRSLGELEHLARYQMMAEGGTVVLRHGDENVDLVKRPGQQLLANFSDVLAVFRKPSGDFVPDLRQPRPNVSIDPAMRGGHPVIRGTRIPFEFVAGFVADGVKPEDIYLYYPGVTPAAARDAADFAVFVAGRVETVPAA